MFKTFKETIKEKQNELITLPFRIFVFRSFGIVSDFDIRISDLLPLIKKQETHPGS